VKVERESVTKTRYTVQGDMKSPLVSADVVTDNTACPIALTFEYGVPPIILSIRTAKAIMTVLTAAVLDTAVTEKSDED
jgi:hypothetical protein